MNASLELQSFLNQNTDNYRIMHSKKKEIKYLKLFDEFTFSNVYTENYKVCIKKEDMNYSIESNDVSYIINRIEEWLINPSISDTIIWYDITEYNHQEESLLRRNKRILEMFDFKLYHKWLDSVSETVDDKQSFQYYFEADMIELTLKGSNKREQYLVKSQMLHYDSVTSKFIINKNNIFLNEQIPKEKDKNKKIDEILSDKNIKYIEINSKIITELLQPVLENFKGENVLGLNSFLKKSSLGVPWLDNHVSIYAKSKLSFDTEGLPKKKISIIKKGVITNFMNTSYAMCLLGSNSCGFSEFEQGDYNGYDETEYEIEVPLGSHNSHCSLVTVDMPFISVEEDVIKVQVKVDVFHDSILYEGAIVFDFKEFMNHLSKSEHGFFIKKDIISLT